ncbi:hypothetical protein D3C81_2125070 [compost metagenome]
MKLLSDFLCDHAVVHSGCEDFDEIVIRFADLRSDDLFDLTDVFQLPRGIDDRVDIEC